MHLLKRREKWTLKAVVYVTFRCSTLLGSDGQALGGDCKCYVESMEVETTLPEYQRL